MAERRRCGCPLCNFGCCISRSDGASGSGSGSPGPLEVKSAEVSRDVDDFAYKVKAGNLTAFHGLRGKRIGADAARSDFCLIETLGAGGCEGPGVETALEFGNAMIREIMRRGCFEKAVDQARRERGAQTGASSRKIAMGG